MDSRNSIKLSVLVTFYNQEEYVDRTLDSILSQQIDFPIEILIGEDGSDDNTVDKIKKWIVKYPDIIKLFQTPKEERERVALFSVSKNRLNLLKHASGEYCIFLDGDDYYCDSTKFRTQVHILDDLRNKECVACAHSMKIRHIDGREECGYIEGLNEGKIYLDLYWEKYYFHTDTILFRKNVLSKKMLDLLEYNFDDNLITFALFQSGPVYYVPQCMSIYNYSWTGLWTGNKKIINVVTTMMMYDLCNVINPNYMKITSKRMAWFWKDILFARREIVSEDFKSYEERLKDKNFFWFEKWVHYNELSKIEQLKLIITALEKSWKTIIREKGGKIYHIFVKRK